MIRLSPKTKWNLTKIIPFGIIWLVMGWVFIVSDAMAVGDGPVPEGTIVPTFRVFVFASFSVFAMGLMVGFLEMVYVNRVFRKLSLLKTIFFKFILYALLFLLVVSLVYPIAAGLELKQPIFSDGVWEKFKLFWGSPAFWSTGLQLGFSLLLSLVYAAISENLGHAVLINFFTGKYHRPQQEERIFMFVDMKSSTTIAEELGHVRYFQFLQQYYDDMAHAIIVHGGEVYQYVGDEIVLTWPKKKGMVQHNCICCFFAMKDALRYNAAKYQKTFGYVPQFKAGLHMGMVTTGEIGALKKEIVYTGDVLNTAARIQGLCNTVEKELLVSENVVAALRNSERYELTSIERMELKGKREQVAIYAVEA